MKSVDQDVEFPDVDPSGCTVGTPEWEHYWIEELVIVTAKCASCESIHTMLVVRAALVYRNEMIRDMAPLTWSTH